MLAEETQQAAFDKKLAQEEAWSRRKPGAQRKRSGARLDALKAMRAERAARRERAGNVTLKLAEAERTGVKVVDAENLSFGYPGGPLLVRDFTTILTRGDKLGLIGPNGAGKTTFIKLLLGQLEPTGGTLKHGTRLEVLYFDQLREQINGDLTVADNIADGNETVTINGRTRHVISYLQDFLFEPARARTPARVLSGGERNRLLLARLFTRPANVLVMDEPTNDLDAETLDLLEDLLVEYQGTLLVVSHDRDFLDNVVTSTLVFEGEGRIGEYIGGYSDWVREKEKQAAQTKAAGLAESDRRSGPVAPAGPAEPKLRKLTNKEQQELESLPARIETLEKQQAELTAKLSDPVFYRTAGAQFTAVKTSLDALEKEHAQAFSRWAELEARRGGS
jgi:ATP-binding cassette subfamily F protein uup